VEATGRPKTLSTAWWWTARFVASAFLLLGALVFSSFLETGFPFYLAMSVLGFGGAAVFVFGIERLHHRSARLARQVGWAMMAVFSLIPTSLLFVPLMVVLLALPAVVRAPRPRAAPGGPLRVGGSIS
jgi:hypothetical protein